MTTIEQRPDSYWTAWAPLGPDRQWTVGPPVPMFYRVGRRSRPWWWRPPYRGFGADAPSSSLSTGQKVGVAAGVGLLLTGVVISIAVSGKSSGRTR